jgi:hypothetical protein
MKMLSARAALLLVVGALCGLGTAGVAQAAPPTVDLAAHVVLSNGGGWFSGGTGPLFRSFLVPGTDPNGAIYGQTNVCGEVWAPYPPLTLSPGTYDFVALDTGNAGAVGSMDVYFDAAPPITVTTLTPNSPPTPIGDTIVTVSNFTLANSDPAIDRVGTCAAFPDGSQDSLARFTITVETVEPVLPTTKDECKNGGWEDFGVFENQGDCVSFVSSVGKNTPGGL